MKSLIIDRIIPSASLLLLLMMPCCTDIYSDIHDSSSGNYRLSVAVGTSGSDFLYLSDDEGVLSDTGYVDLVVQNTSAVRLADFDGNGNLDILAVNGSAGTGDTIYYFDDKGDYSGYLYISANTLQSFDAQTGDFNGDGNMDYFVVGTNGHQMIAGDGSGNFYQAWIQPSGAFASTSVCKGDFDADGDLDVFIGNNTNPKELWLNDGTGNFTMEWTTGALDVTMGTAAGDLDSDGDIDLCTADDSGRCSVYLNDGRGNFKLHWQTGTDSDNVDILLADIDGDGDLDAFVPIIHGPACQVLINDGNGNFTEKDTTYTDSNITGGAAGDIDRDGDIDIFLCNDSSSSRVLLNNGDATFTLSPETGYPAIASSAALGVIAK